MRQALGDCGSGADISRIEETEREFGIVTLLVRGVRRFLHVELCEHAQQRRTHIGATRGCKTGEVIQRPAVCAVHAA